MIVLWSQLIIESELFYILNIPPIIEQITAFELFTFTSNVLGTIETHNMNSMLISSLSCHGLKRYKTLSSDVIDMLTDK